MIKTVKLPQGQEAVIRTSWYNAFILTRKTKAFLKQVREGLLLSLVPRTPIDLQPFPTWMEKVTLTAYHDGLSATATIERVPVPTPEVSTDLSIEMIFDNGRVRDHYDTVVPQAMWWGIYSETRYAVARLRHP